MASADISNDIDTTELNKFLNNPQAQAEKQQNCTGEKVALVVLAILGAGGTVVGCLGIFGTNPQIAQALGRTGCIASAAAGGGILVVAIAVSAVRLCTTTFKPQHYIWSADPALRYQAVETVEDNNQYAFVERNGAHYLVIRSGLGEDIEFLITREPLTELYTPVVIERGGTFVYTNGHREVPLFNLDGGTLTPNDDAIDSIFNYDVPLVRGEGWEFAPREHQLILKKGALTLPVFIKDEHIPDDFESPYAKELDDGGFDYFENKSVGVGSPLIRNNLLNQLLARQLLLAEQREINVPQVAYRDTDAIVEEVKAAMLVEQYPSGYAIMSAGDKTYFAQVLNNFPNQSICKLYDVTALVQDDKITLPDGTTLAEMIEESWVLATPHFDLSMMQSTTHDLSTYLDEDEKQSPVPETPPSPIAPVPPRSPLTTLPHRHISFTRPFQTLEKLCDRLRMKVGETAGVFAIANYLENGENRTSLVIVEADDMRVISLPVYSETADKIANSVLAHSDGTYSYVVNQDEIILLARKSRGGQLELLLEGYKKLIAVGFKKERYTGAAVKKAGKEAADSDTTVATRKQEAAASLPKVNFHTTYASVDDAVAALRKINPAQDKHAVVFRVGNKEPTHVAFFRDQIIYTAEFGQNGWSFADNQVKHNNEPLVQVDATGNTTVLPALKEQDDEFFAEMSIHATTATGDAYHFSAVKRSSQDSNPPFSSPKNADEALLTLSIGRSSANTVHTEFYIRLEENRVLTLRIGEGPGTVQLQPTNAFYTCWDHTVLEISPKNYSQINADRVTLPVGNSTPQGVHNVYPNLQSAQDALEPSSHALSANNKVVFIKDSEGTSVEVAIVDSQNEERTCYSDGDALYYCFSISEKLELTAQNYDKIVNDSFEPNESHMVQLTDSKEDSSSNSTDEKET
ncbi:MAG: hypothetical protein H7A36_07210 [Chlamydiales bacterium]|nr:hypothetical protein [Chlamydiales bacterium]